MCIIPSAYIQQPLCNTFYTSYLYTVEIEFLFLYLFYILWKLCSFFCMHAGFMCTFVYTNDAFLCWCDSLITQLRGYCTSNGRKLILELIERLMLRKKKCYYIYFSYFPWKERSVEYFFSLYIVMFINNTTLAGCDKFPRYFQNFHKYSADFSFDTVHVLFNAICSCI